MVTAKTRFALGDKVYHLGASGTSIISSVVSAIRIEWDGTRKYSFGYIDSFDWQENELYDTPDEVANVQKNKVLNNNKVNERERTEDVEFIALPREKVYYFYNGKVYRGRIKYSETSHSVGKSKKVYIEKRNTWCGLYDLVIIDNEHFIAKTKNELAEKVLEYYKGLTPSKEL